MNTHQSYAPYTHAVLPSMEELHDVFYGDLEMTPVPAQPHLSSYNQRTPMPSHSEMYPCNPHANFSASSNTHGTPVTAHNYNMLRPAQVPRASENTPLLFTNIPKLSKVISISELKPIPQLHQVHCQWKKACPYITQPDSNSVKAHLFHSHQPDVWSATDPNYTIVCFWEWCGTPIAGGGLDMLVKHVRETHLGVEDIECPFCGLSTPRQAFKSHAHRYHPEVHVRA